jgi:hypothetical protein
LLLDEAPVFGPISFPRLSSGSFAIFVAIAAPHLW